MFPWVDGAVSLLGAGLIVLLAGGRHRLRLLLLDGLLFLQFWHFAPRVLPPTEPRQYFDRHHGRLASGGPGQGRPGAFPRGRIRRLTLTRRGIL